MFIVEKGPRAQLRPQKGDSKEVSIFQYKLHWPIAKGRLSQNIVMCFPYGFSLKVIVSAYPRIQNIIQHNYRFLHCFLV